MGGSFHSYVGLPYHESPFVKFLIPSAAPQDVMIGWDGETAGASLGSLVLRPSGPGCHRLSQFEGCASYP